MSGCMSWTATTLSTSGRSTCEAGERDLTGEIEPVSERLRRSGQMSKDPAPEQPASELLGSPPDATPVGRRVVLGLLGLGAAGVAFGPAVSRGLGSVAGALSKHDPTGLSSYIPGAGWRYYTVTDSFPYHPPSSYRLAVTGNVANELTLTTNDLRGRRRTRLTADFQCVTGWRVPRVRWEGVRLSELLDEAQPDADQAGVEFVSYDGAYTESLTIAQA